jgi:hypothetical protein
VTTLVEEIVHYIRNQVSGVAVKRDGLIAELRSEFHGPPLEFLNEVFESLTAGGGLEIVDPIGTSVKIPVVLQVDRLDDGVTNPAIDGSGVCLAPHVLEKRNYCPHFVVLVPPGRQSGMSVKTASDYFGLSSKNNAGNATIAEWWSDDFVQSLVGTGLDRLFPQSPTEKEEAWRLIENAIIAADEVDRHEVARHRCWNVLSRLFSLPANGVSGRLVSLASGFPSFADGRAHYAEQNRVLRSIADLLMNSGFKAAIEQLKEKATTEDEVALDSFLAHAQRVCDVPTAFGNATSFFYAPMQSRDISEVSPDWWEHLTIERWTELLEEEHQPEESLRIKCTNSILPIRSGIPALVLNAVELRVEQPSGSQVPLEVNVTRETGPVAKRQSWSLMVPDNVELVDRSPPNHRTPIRYTTNAAEGSRKSAVRVISLETWEPGVYAFCQTAKKITAPKKVKSNRERVVLESSLSLTGIGRHYIDLYVHPGTTVGEILIATDAAESTPDVTPASMSRVSDHAYGFEVDTTGECYCDILIDRGNGEEKFRLNLSCEETTIVGCGSEFERLLGLNQSRLGSTATKEVVINRQLRCFDLQSWMLDPHRVMGSYFPLVLGPDHAESWSVPSWEGLQGTILSSGKFLQDPRPTLDRMQPRKDFLEAREAIASRIRDDDGSGVVETAKLGEWLCGQGGSAGDDHSFAEELDRYLKAYHFWLEEEPEVAAWVDLVAIASFERDGMTLAREPDAILLNPLHPMRLAWQALAQKSLYEAYRANAPCPAASILDASRIPDVLVLPLQTASGSTKHQPFLSVECSSDYWSVLWNSNKLDSRAERVQSAPFDKEFGLQVGGASSGFSVSQVRRALDDVHAILAAKPVISVAVSSAAGQNNAFDEGLLSWARERFGKDEKSEQKRDSLGPRMLKVFDDRQALARPDDISLANLAEDTENSVRWFSGLNTNSKPDLGIIAQLESSSPDVQQTGISSPVGAGALIRHRIRQQLPGAQGAFLNESRMGVSGPPSGEGLADRLMNCVIRLENLGTDLLGYTFASSVHEIQSMLRDKEADFVAVSSSVVDPACFLGEWLNDAYLWDYHLPSYSQRAGDTNGYYLISQVKELDRETLNTVLRRLPGSEQIDDEDVTTLLLEVARRGIPTVRGLSGGDTGATGDLGLFIAARLLQDEFRPTKVDPGLLPVMSEVGGSQVLSMVIPVDPFQGYLNDIQKSLDIESAMRPDLLVAGIEITDSVVRCHLTPVEVKYRNSVTWTNTQCVSALDQAKALSSLLLKFQDQAENSDLLLWKIAFQHFVLSMLGYGFRVYSQQTVANERSQLWTESYQRVASAILSGEIELTIDSVGRLIVIDDSTNSSPRDVDGDGFQETVVVSPSDASRVLLGDPEGFYDSIRNALGNWDLNPTSTLSSEQSVAPAPAAKIVEIEPPDDGGAEETELSEPIENHPVATSEKPPIESSLTGMELLVGTRVDAFEENPELLNLSDTNLNQLNIGVVGDLGTGKTQFLKSLVYQISQSKVENAGVQPKFLIFDYKKDYSSEDFVEATGARIQSPSNLPLNLFDVSGETEDKNAWLRRYQFFSDVLDKIYSGIGPVQRQHLKKAVKASYEVSKLSGKQPTIYDVHQQYELLLNGKIDSIFGILDDLVDMELFSRDPGEGSGFSDFLDGVVVIQLNELGQDDRTKNMLVAVMLNLFYENMLTIPKRPYVGEDPQLRVIDSFLLVDEADNILKYEFDVLKKILLQGREFGVGVILASQYLRHFKVGASDYREPLLTWFIHKVPNIVPQELAALGLTADIAQLSDRVKMLPNHHCLFKTVDVAGEVINGKPFWKLISDV